MASTVLSRWKGRLAARLRLLTAARKRHIEHPTAESRHILERRKAQVAEAERVVKRHMPHPSAESVSSRGVKFIAGFEGCILHPYRDAVGVWTIGYGHTRGVGPGTRPLPDRAAAMALLRRDLDDCYAPPVRAMAKELGLRLKQGQFDALVSLVYNCGPGCIAQGTTIRRCLARRDFQGAANGFLLWDKAGGRPMLGLTRRREAERRMFLDA